MADRKLRAEAVGLDETVDAMAKGIHLLTCRQFFEVCEHEELPQCTEQARAALSAGLTAGGIVTRGEVETLRVALAYYGSSANWTKGYEGPVGDGGRRARSILDQLGDSDA